MFAKHVICGTLLLCFATEIAQAQLNIGLILSRGSMLQDQQKRGEDRKFKENLANDFRERGKKISDSLRDIQESEHLHRQAIKQIYDANLDEVARWGEMFKPTQKPQDADTYKFGPSSGEGGFF